MADKESERQRLMDEVARNNEKAFWGLGGGDAADSKGGAVDSKRRAGKQKVALKHWTPATSRRFFKKLQQDAQIVPVAQDGKSLKGLEAGRAADFDKTFGEFDRIYKPYVFYLLERHYYFRREVKKAEADDPCGAFDVKVRRGSKLPLRNNGIDAEEIYDDVVAALLGGALWRFDFDRERVGQGAFRRYLGDMVRSAFYNRVRPELVPEFDLEGRPVYTDEFEKDRRGRVKKDGNGDPVRKQKMVSRLVFEKEQAEIAHVKGLPHLFATRKASDSLFVFLYRLAKVAYLRTIEEKSVKGRAEWQVEAMRAVFERQESGAAVIERLTKDGAITGRQAFDTAKSYFLARWRKCWDGLCDQIIEKRTIGSGSAVVRCLSASEDDALRYIAGLEEENGRKFGSARIKAVDRNFAKAMLMLMRQDDERKVEKNAKFYGQTE